MHNLAIALSLKGYEVTGSDDEIFEPARGRLRKYGLLPEKEGWDAERIHPGLEAVILGMHAKADNPELQKARELGIRIFSYPEYLFEQSRDKTRVVIAGSHGKTTITAMILHVLKAAGIETDFMVGAQLDGFEVMVRLSSSASYIVLEGDEYLSSALDIRPKFHLYKPHIALLSGIAWDHMNVFPTFEDYCSQFSGFINTMGPGGKLIFCADDREVSRIVSLTGNDLEKIPYGDLGYVVKDQVTYLLWNGQRIPVQVFGKHNVQNIHGAWMVCRSMGVSDGQFMAAIGTFTGASKRLQALGRNDTTVVFKDFAHSPSKLKATIHAVRELFPDRKLVACLELHTFSSLNKDFLPLYRHCMDLADIPIVYYSHHALQLKRLPALNPEEVKQAFAAPGLIIFNDSAEMRSYLVGLDFQGTNLLMMSSGNFDGLDLEGIAKEILS